MELTPAGRAFLVSARASIAAAERAAADARAAAGEIAGTLTIGLIPTVTVVDVPAMIGAFHRAHPAVRITLREGASDELIEGIETRTIDIAIVGLPATSRLPERISSRCIAREQLVLVAGEGHRFAARKRLRLRDLTDEVFADFPAGTPGRAQSELAFAAAGVRRQVAFEAGVVGRLAGLAAEGLALVLLPLAAVPRDERLRTVRVTDGPVRSEHLCWSEFNLTPAARAMLGQLEAELLAGSGENAAAAAG